MHFLARSVPRNAVGEALALRCAGLQRQRVQLAAHLALERLVDDLVLLDAGFAAERFGDHGCGIMVAVAGEVADRYLGVGNARSDQALDIVRGHGHGYRSLTASRFAAEALFVA